MKSGVIFPGGRARWIPLIPPSHDHDDLAVNATNPIWVSVYGPNGTPLKVSREFLKTLRAEGWAGTENVPEECLT